MDATTAQYLEMHNANPSTFSGRSTRFHVQPVKNLIDQYSAQSILDYGCGQGEQYSKSGADKVWGISPALYDPGVDRYSTLPAGQFDGVICIDVLEHIIIEELPGILDEIQRCASKFVYLVIAQFEVRDTLPDGRMAHVSIFSDDKWLGMIRENLMVPTHVVFRTSGNSFKFPVVLVP
ncbi:MAG: methyltransferase domain-containing protein [Sterolibacterium sp.]